MRAALKPCPPSAFRTANRPLIAVAVAVAVVSGVINVLALTGAIYMLQVRDRVFPSRALAPDAVVAFSKAFDPAQRANVDPNGGQALGRSTTPKKHWIIELGWRRGWA